MNEAQIQDWEEVNRILDKYTVQGEVFCSPAVTNYFVENGIDYWDYGQGEYNTAEIYDIYNQQTLISSVFSNAGTIFEKYIKNEEDVRRKMKNGEYSCIVTDDVRGYNSYMMSGECNKYTLYKDILLFAGTNEIPIHIYLLSE